VGQNFIASLNEKIPDSAVTAQLMLDQFLKPHQIIDQDPVGRFQGDGLSQAFSLGAHCLQQASLLPLAGQQ
jgi:hypothetical protein